MWLAVLEGMISAVLHPKPSGFLFSTILFIFACEETTYMLAPLLPPDGRALGNGRKEMGKQGKFAPLLWGLVTACVFLGMSFVCAEG